MGRSSTTAKTKRGATSTQNDPTVSNSGFVDPTETDVISRTILDQNPMHSQRRNFASPLAFPNFSSSNFLQQNNNNTPLQPTTSNQQQQFLLQQLHRQHIDFLRQRQQQHQYPLPSSAHNNNETDFPVEVSVQQQSRRHCESTSPTQSSSCESSSSCIIAASVAAAAAAGAHRSNNKMATPRGSDYPQPQQLYSNRNIPPHTLLLRNPNHAEQSLPLPPLPLPPRRPPQKRLTTTMTANNNNNNKTHCSYDAFLMPPCTPSGISFASSMPKTNVMPPGAPPTTATTSHYAAPSCTTAFSSASPSPTSSASSSPASSSTICTETTNSGAAAASNSGQQRGGAPNVKHYMVGRKAGLLVLLTALFAITAVASVLLIYLIGLRRGATSQRDLDESVRGLLVLRQNNFNNLPATEADRLQTQKKLKNGRQSSQFNVEPTGTDSGPDTLLQAGNAEQQNPVWLRAFESNVEIVLHDRIPFYTPEIVDSMYRVIGTSLHEQLDNTLSKTYPTTYIFSEVRGQPPTNPNREAQRPSAPSNGTELDAIKKFQWTSYFRPSTTTSANDTSSSGAPLVVPDRISDAAGDWITEQNIRDANLRAIQSMPWPRFTSWEVKLDTLTTREEVATTPRPLTFDLALLPPEEVNSTSPSTSTTTALNSVTPTAVAVPNIYHMNAHRNIYSSSNSGDNKFDQLTLGNRVPIVVTTRRPSQNFYEQSRARHPFMLDSKSSVLVPLGVPSTLVSQIGGVRRPQTASSPVRQTKIDKAALFPLASSTIWPVTTIKTGSSPSSVVAAAAPAQCVGQTTTPQSDGASFQCLTASGVGCIVASMVCDGHADCLDGSDESAAVCKQHNANQCNTDQFSCDHGKCHQLTQRCDGREDCDDGTDEHNCTQCSHGAFLCANGFCRSRSAYCNKLNDCDDWSDEQSPTNNCSSCYPDQFRCRNGQCVFGETCDGQLDCFDGSDERNCSCLARFERIAPDKICDGYKDCPDGEDEEACLAASSCAAVIVSQQADGSHDAQHNNGMFQCANSDKCIRMARVCDAVIDCPDSSDEAFCYQLSADGQTIDKHKIVLRNEGVLMWNVAGTWLPVCAASFNSSWSGGICRGMSFNASRKEAGIRLPSSGGSYAHFDIIEARYVVRDYCENDIVVHMSCQTLMCGKNPAAYTPTKPMDNRVFARIVGGNNADPAQWPWQAALYRDGQYVCGATLIDDQWLLSAAHCFYNYMHRYWAARLGAWRLSSPSPYSQMRRITHAVVLDTYDMFGSSDGDVALLRLESPVALTHWARPACLPPRQNVPLAGDDCYAIGWGLRSEDGAKADVLQEARVPVINNSLCNAIQDREYNGKITDYMICAGGDGVDSCQGDSGGPLLCRDGDSWYLAGVVSFGHGCGGGPQRPGVYTRTAKAKAWILDAMEAARRGNLSEAALIKPFNCFGYRCIDGKCLRKEQVCDGVSNCLDGADEKGCSVNEGYNKQCQEWHFPCHNGRCVDSLLHCNGADDCGDQSDEFDCTGSFHSNETTTSATPLFGLSGRKSPPQQDEFSSTSPTSAALAGMEPTLPTIQQPLPSTRSALAFFPKLPLTAQASSTTSINNTVFVCPTATHFQCANGQQCIPKNLRCDGRISCTDRSDELGCQGACPTGQFGCFDGTCRADDAWCNGYNDCGDWSDEPLNCTCKQDTQFQCHSGACIAQERRCDGKPGDCADLSDEFNCSCVSIIRASTLPDRLCDNYPDCANYADEMDCASSSTTPSCDAVNEFQCPSGAHQCIKRAQVCDDVEDCAEKEDENNCMMLAADSPSGTRAAESAHLMLRPESGYLLLNINGSWYPTCADGWDKFSDLLLPVICTLMGQSIVRARVSFEDISATNRKEFQLNGTGKKLTEFAKVRGTTLSHVTTCDQQMIVKIQCGESLCGIAQASITPLSATLVRLLTEQQQSRFSLPQLRSLTDDFDSNTGASRRVSRSKSTTSSLQQLIMSSSGVTDDNSSPTSNSGRRIPRPQQTPWQAAVYVDGEFKCSATILTPRWAITAAHCLPRPDQMHLHYVTLRAGVWRLNADPPFQQIRVVDAVVQRPYSVVVPVSAIKNEKNDRSSKAYVPNDVALVRFASTLDTGDWTRAVCLPDAHDFAPTNQATNNFDASPTHKNTDATVFDGMECSMVAWNPASSVALSPSSVIPPMMMRSASAADSLAQQRLMSASSLQPSSSLASNDDAFAKTLRSDRNIRTTTTYAFPSSRRVLGNMTTLHHSNHRNSAPRNQLYETAFVVMDTKQCNATYFNGQLPNFSLCARPKTVLPVNPSNSQKLGRASSSMPSTVIAGLCEYEAGSALACPSSSGQVTIIGVASYGPCEQPADVNRTGKISPSIFTAILPLTEWINFYIKANESTLIDSAAGGGTDAGRKDSSLPSFPAISSATCRGGGFRCALGRCLPLSKRCDGIRQCLFGEDEAQCDAASPSSSVQPQAALAGKCRQYDFGCLNGRCIEANSYCNGRNDCGDNSDEPPGCRSECVRGSEFQCEQTRKCIPRAWQCDSFSDCEDGSDERNCSNGCPPMPTLSGTTGGGTGRFYQCPNSTRCIPPSFVCDGIRDCADAADETQCGCPPGHFKCSNGKCIAGLHKFCDGVPDCAPDHTDEKYCKADKQDCHVRATQFKCRSGECISIKWVCDGAPDCVSRDDEVDCDSGKHFDDGNNNAVAPEKHSTACPTGFVRCKHANECINEAWICDGEPDCSDKSDEMNCGSAASNNGVQTKTTKPADKNAPVIDPSPQTPQRWFSDPPDSNTHNNGDISTSTGGSTIQSFDDIMPNADPTTSPWFIHNVDTSSTPNPETTTRRPPSSTTLNSVLHDLTTRSNIPPWLFPLAKQSTTTSKPLTTNAVKVFTVSTHKQRPVFPTTTIRPGFNGIDLPKRPFDSPNTSKKNTTLFLQKATTTASPLTGSEFATTIPLDLLGIDFSQTDFGSIFPPSGTVASKRPPAAASTLATPLALPVPQPTVFSLRDPTVSPFDGVAIVSGACNLTTHFRCHRRPMCLHRDRLCDGWPDCPNGSDEMFCRARQQQTQTAASSLASDSSTNRYSIDCLRDDAFLCWQSAKCVARSHVCDSAFQCPHGEDERYCITISQTLPSSNSSASESTSSLIGLPISTRSDSGGGGDSSPSGMVMIRHAGVWYPLCATTWTHRLSQAVCRQQMYTGVASSRLVNASLLVQPKYDNVLASLTTTTDEKQRRILRSEQHRMFAAIRRRLTQSSNKDDAQNDVTASMLSVVDHSPAPPTSPTAEVVPELVGQSSSSCQLVQIECQTSLCGQSLSNFYRKTSVGKQPQKEFTSTNNIMGRRGSTSPASAIDVVAHPYNINDDIANNQFDALSFLLSSGGGGSRNERSDAPKYRRQTLVPVQENSFTANAFEAATPGEVPWQVLLYVNGVYRCAAFLLSNNMILAGVTCAGIERQLSSRRRGSSSPVLTARLGVWRLQSVSPFEQSIRISHIIPLRPQQQQRPFNDRQNPLPNIAAYVLEHPVMLFGRTLAPICLPQANDFVGLETEISSESSTSPSTSFSSEADRAQRRPFAAGHNNNGRPFSAGHGNKPKRPFSQNDNSVRSRTSQDQPQSFPSTPSFLHGKDPTTRNARSKQNQFSGNINCRLTGWRQQNASTSSSFSSLASLADEDAEVLQFISVSLFPLSTCGVSSNKTKFTQPMLCAQADVPICPDFANSLLTCQLLNSGPAAGDSSQSDRWFALGIAARSDDPNVPLQCRHRPNALLMSSLADRHVAEWLDVLLLPPADTTQNKSQSRPFGGNSGNTASKNRRTNTKRYELQISGTPCNTCTYTTDGNSVGSNGTDGFLCEIDGLCVPAERVCDGLADCLDAADEINCTSLCGAIGGVIFPQQPSTAQSNAVRETNNNNNNENGVMMPDYDFIAQLKVSPVADLQPPLSPNDEVFLSMQKDDDFSHTTLLQTLLPCDASTQCHLNDSSCICHPSNFRCDGLCKPSQMVFCNGRCECSDCSDEPFNCTCLASQFFCPLTGNCMSMLLKCDGKRDCGEFDEDSCNLFGPRTTTSSFDQAQEAIEKSSKTITTTAADVCSVDALQFSCTNPYGVTDFGSPGSNGALPSERIGAGFVVQSPVLRGFLAGSTSAEEPNQPSKFHHETFRPQFANMNASVKSSSLSVCRDVLAWCDGFRDCPDGADELDCKDVCPIGYRHCPALAPLRNCIPSTAWCDGKEDCRNGADELPDCECTEAQFRCSPTSPCMPKSKLCDHTVDCPNDNAFDEVNCTCRDYLRGSSPSTTGGLNSAVCDGIVDCDDGTDELGCSGSPWMTQCGTVDGHLSAQSASAPSAAMYYYQCEASAQCIEADKLCDGHVDCSPNGDDEAGCLVLAGETTKQARRGLYLSTKTPVSSGYVLVKQQQKWSAICFDNDIRWNNEHSDVICRAIGYRRANDTRRAPLPLTINVDGDSGEEKLGVITLSKTQLAGFPDGLKSLFSSQSYNKSNKKQCSSNKAVHVSCSDWDCSLPKLAAEASTPSILPFSAIIYVADEPVCEAVLIDAEFLITTGSCLQSMLDYEQYIRNFSALPRQPRSSTITKAAWNEARKQQALSKTDANLFYLQRTGLVSLAGMRRFASSSRSKRTATTKLWTAGGEGGSDATHQQQMPPLTARLGVRYIHNHNRPSVEQLRRIVKWRVHPDFVFRAGTPGRFLVQNDVAILKMASPVVFNKHVRPACLPSSSLTSLPEEKEVVFSTAPNRAAEQDRRCFTLGLGQNRYTVNSTNVHSWQQCNRLMPVLEDAIQPEQVCTDERSCDGLSGSALVCYGLEANSTTRRWTVEGIKSFRLSCDAAGSAASVGPHPVYTAMHGVVGNWIARVMASETGATTNNGGSNLGNEQRLDVALFDWNSLPCALGHFQCPLGRCIEDAHVMDGKWDCRGGADEPRLLVTKNKPSTTTSNPDAWTEPPTDQPPRIGRPASPGFKTTTKNVPTFTTTTTSSLNGIVFPSYDDGSSSSNPNTSVVTLSSDATTLPVQTTAFTLPSDSAETLNFDVDVVQQAPQPPCPLKYFECDNRCLPERYQCDSIPDCSQLEDERNCLSCPPDQVPCPRTRTCVERTRVCDGHADCALGEDEEHCVILRNEFNNMLSTSVDSLNEPPSAAVVLDALGHTPSAEQGYLLIRQGERYEPVCTNVWTPSLAGAVCRHLQFGQVNFTSNLLEQVRNQQQPQLQFNNFSASRQHTAIPMPLTYATRKSLIDTLQQIAEQVPPTSQKFAELLAYDGSSRVAAVATAAGCTKVKVTCMEPQCGVIQTGLLFTEQQQSNMENSSSAALNTSTMHYYWPWAAALFQHNRFICTGYTLWNRHWLLLPSHCSRRLRRQTTIVRIGASRLATSSPYEFANRLTGYVNHPTLPFLLGRLAEPLRPAVSDVPAATVSGSSSKQQDIQFHRLICSPQQLLPVRPPADDVATVSSNNNSRQSAENNFDRDQIDLVPNNVDECRIVGWQRGDHNKTQRRAAGADGLIRVVSVRLHTQNSCMEQQKRQARSTVLRKNLRCVEAINTNTSAATLSYNSCVQNVGHAVFCRSRSTAQWSLYGMTVAFTTCKPEQRIWLVEPLIGAGVEWTESIIKQFSSFNFLRNISVGLDCNFDKGTTCGYRPRPHSLVALSSAASPPLTWTPELSSFTQFDKTVRNSISAHLILPTAPLKSGYYRNSTSAVPAELLASSQFGQTKHHSFDSGRNTKITASAQLVSPIISISIPDETALSNDSSGAGDSSSGMCLRFHYRTGMYSRLNVLRRDAIGLTETLWSSLGPEPVSPNTNRMWASGRVIIPLGKYEIIFEGILTKPNRDTPTRRPQHTVAAKSYAANLDFSAPPTPAVPPHFLPSHPQHTMAAMQMPPAADNSQAALPLLSESAVPSPLFLPVADNYGYYFESFSSSAPEIWLDDIEVVALTHCKARY